MDEPRTDALARERPADAYLSDCDPGDETDEAPAVERSERPLAA